MVGLDDTIDLAEKSKIKEKREKPLGLLDTIFFMIFFMIFFIGLGIFWLHQGFQVLKDNLADVGIHLFFTLYIWFFACIMFYVGFTPIWYIMESGFNQNLSKNRCGYVDKKDKKNNGYVLVGDDMEIKVVISKLIKVIIVLLLTFLFLLWWYKTDFCPEDKITMFLDGHVICLPRR